jgi:hypothetical protein
MITCALKALHLFQLHGINTKQSLQTSRKHRAVSVYVA